MFLNGESWIIFMREFYLCFFFWELFIITFYMNKDIYYKLEIFKIISIEFQNKI
mgnify:CR=1 FL=1|jgi:hypothetical protein